MQPYPEREQPSPSISASLSGARIAETVVGPTLCAVRVWTDAEWAVLPEDERPARREHVPGLGWVAAVPVEGLN